MAKNEWLYCGNDWSDIINIIKLEKNRDERLREFHAILKREGLAIKNVIDENIEDLEDLELMLVCDRKV